jgi:hypothetical protein
MSTQSSTNPGSKSPEEVQREVRESRAEVEQTLEAIQERPSRSSRFSRHRTPRFVAMTRASDPRMTAPISRRSRWVSHALNRRAPSAGR